ncbi:MAG: AMP-dependent synthetase/ligase, partial [bacterium]
MARRNLEPWRFLEAYKGEVFSGDWPTIPQMFSITVSRHGDNTAFTRFDPDELSLTYKQAEETVHRTARYLIDKGVSPGDRVAINGHNSPEWALGYLAILYAGAVVVPLDYQLRDDQLEELIKFSEVKVLLVDEDRYDTLATHRRSGVKHRISLAPSKPAYILDLERPSKPKDLPDRDLDDLAAILYTSGTTGNHKGVMLTHRNLVADCYLAQANMNLYSSDVFYALLPIHHSYTMLAVFLEAISVGAEVVFARRLVVQQILKELKRGKVTMFLAIPMLFNKMLKGLIRGIREKGKLVYAVVRTLMLISGGIKKLTGLNPGKKLFKGLLAKLSLDTNRICICGGGPLPSSTFRMFNQLGIDFVQGYGLTETSPILTLNPVDRYKEDSVGKLLPNVRMKILEPDDRGVGEIAVKGPMVMQGYYKNDDATREAFTEDGWFRTGDLGYLDDEDYLYLTGRKKSMIVTEGGKNIFPEEIEEQFQLYDEIDQIMVRGYVKDERMKTEGIEALVHPAYPHFDAQGKERHREYGPEEIEARINEIIADVNKRLRPFERIERVTVLEEP